jgi:hypothetical protein
MNLCLTTYYIEACKKDSDELFKVVKFEDGATETDKRYIAKTYIDELRKKNKNKLYRLCSRTEIRRILKY